MNLSQTNIITVANLFLVVGGMITLVGGIIVYFNKKKHKRK